MRKLYIMFALLAALLVAALPAAADSYHFSKIFLSLDIPVDPYQVQITAQNLGQNEGYLSEIGETQESMKKRFEEEGILVWAYDAGKGRTLVVTAVQDDSARLYYDINEQTPETRATYRACHTNGVLYSKTDYAIESCEWKNFGEEQGRFLMVRYTRKIDGKAAWKGEWRRTIRSGYTITVDMRVTGRNITSGDIAALNVIQDSISFVEVSEAPEALLTLAFSAPPPENTDTDTFTIKGVTRPGASVVAAYAALQSSKSKAFYTMADGKGAFSIEVKLPGRDLYNMIVNATVNEGTEAEQSVSQEFSVEYDPTSLPVSFTSPFPDQFTTDSFKLAGTTMTGVTVQLVVNNELQTKKTGNNRTFSFTVDTSAEGEYNISLTFTKKDYDTKIYRYTISRVMEEGQRRQVIREQSVSPDYSAIVNNPARYEGRILRYKGYIGDVRDNGSEWVLTFYTEKAGEKLKNPIIVLSTQQVEADPDTLVTMYGTMTGTYSMLTETGEERFYPRMSLAFID
ncbi:MAG: hypothetical protein J5564_03890 [Clostridia bacterium]|nr:hypothetical protein [Clostridia bacterium]